MANEMLVSSVDGDFIYAVFILPIDSPKQDDAGDNLVVTPTSGLTTAEQAAISTEFLNMMDSGTRAYVRENISTRDGAGNRITGGALLARAQARYQTVYQTFNIEYNDKYHWAQHIGATFDSGTAA